MEKPRPKAAIHNRSSRRHHRERGSAIITVILVILVLTVIGIGVAYLTQIEDRISGNDRLQKAGFYAAEAGLRVGEQAIRTAISNPSQFTFLLTGTPVTIPGGGYAAYPLVLDIPGSGPHTYQNESIYGATPPSVIIDNATYSLFVRNNVEDASGSATIDTDSQLNLISFGQVTLPTGLGAIQKILEESIVIAIGGGQFGTQKGANAGGTGSATID